MKIILIALKQLWKNKFLNLILIIEMVLAIMMLDQEFVFVFKHIDNARAIKELNFKNSDIFTTYKYYEENDVNAELLQAKEVKDIGKVYSGLAITEDNQYELVAYTDSIIKEYRPLLSAGKWFYEDNHNDLKQAVVTKGTGYRVGDIVSVDYDESKINVMIIGILNEPNQYFLPNGGSSKDIYSIEYLISQQDAIIVQAKDLASLPRNYFSEASKIKEPILIFYNENITLNERKKFESEYSKYGQIVNFDNAINNYTKDTFFFINLGLVFLGAFMLLAIISTLAINIIQQKHNQKRYTVYFLLGMKKSEIFILEAIRILFLETVIVLLSILLAKSGSFMLLWILPERIIAFFAAYFIISLLIFIAVGIGFWTDLARSDISQSIKNLQQGE